MYSIFVERGGYMSGTKKRIFAEHGIQNTGFYHTMSLVRGKYKLPILYDYFAPTDPERNVVPLH